MMQDNYMYEYVCALVLIRERSSRSDVHDRSKRALVCERMEGRRK